MAKISIQFLAKNGSYFPNVVRIESDTVPRVGELLDAQDILGLSGDQVSNFIVCSVIYKVTEGGFAPQITAREWFRGIRSEFLQERGWLLPDNSTPYIHYDEDDHQLD